MRRRLVILAAAGLIAGVVLYLVYGERGSKESVIRTSGIVEGTEVNLSSKVSGRIQRICCSEGDVIRETQAAITLESDDIRASVEQARAGVERARADIASAESGVENAKAVLQSAEAEIASAEAEVEKSRVQMDELKREMDRAKELSQKGFISQETAEQAIAAYDTAVTSLRAAQARLNASRAARVSAASQVNAARGQVSASLARLKEAEANLAFNESKLRDTVITSPLTGVVVFKALEEGEYATPGTAILTVVDTAGLYVRIDLEETLAAAVALHAQATVTVEGLKGRQFKGRVAEIGRYAEFATQRDVTRGRQDIKTFRVKVRADDPDGLLKPGMTVFVEIEKKR
jgi:HlyD family secretion protein